MTSELQSETSRRNGAKSRGPKTPAGKSNSSRNGTTHGMLSKTIVIEGEVAARFAALLATLRDDLKPLNSIEDGLVEDLATCRWRQRRILAMETACLTHEIQHQEPGAPTDTNATRAAHAYRSLSTDSRTLALFNVYELRFDRQYNRILHRFFAIRAARKMDSATSNPGSS